MKPTMKDVAKLAGVGVGTVSRVINKNPSVKASTLKKVEDAIKELNYTPNEYARGMKSKHTNTVALIIPTIWHPYFGEFAYHVESTLSDLGYKLLLCNSNGSAEKELEYIQMVKQNRVDGIIGITYSDIDKYIDSDLPFVSIDRHFTEDVTYVTADNLKAAKLAFSELQKRGVTNFAYIGGHQDTPNETKNRLKGFEESCIASGVNYHILDMIEPIYDFDDQVEKFLIDNPDINGIFAINDFAALDVINIIKKLGKRVPEDIQVIGCDGIKLASERDYLVSTIRQPLLEMADVSVELLINLIMKKPVNKRTKLDVEFIEGFSTIN